MAVEKRNFRIVLLFLIIYSSLLYSAKVIKSIPFNTPFYLDSSGDIYVKNDEHSISCYDPEGKFKFKFGRDGEGPGDIKRMGWFAFNPADNCFYITEFYNGNKWISRFDKQGKFISIWKCELDWSTFKALNFIKFDSKGNAFIQTNSRTSRKYKEGFINCVEENIIKLSPAGKILKKIYKFVSDFDMDVAGKGEITIPFGNYLYWEIFDDELFIRENINDYICLFDGDGKEIKKILLPFRREKITAEDINRWEEWMNTTSMVKEARVGGRYTMKYWRDLLPIPEFKPVCGGLLFFDSNNNIFSRKYTGYSHNADIWAKINYKTGETCVIQWRGSKKLIDIQGKFFYLLSENNNGDDEDNEYYILKVDEKEFYQKYARTNKD